MPRFDGPYTIIGAWPEKSTYMLELPNSPNTFPTFHVSQLRMYHVNDATLYPNREPPRPGPTVDEPSGEEWEIERIVDERTRGRGKQYLVRWKGWGDEDMRWLPCRELEETEALDRWLGEDGAARS
jgi:hypothetical protein